MPIGRGIRALRAAFSTLPPDAHKSWRAREGLRLLLFLLACPADDEIACAAESRTLRLTRRHVSANPSTALSLPPPGGCCDRLDRQHRARQPIKKTLRRVPQQVSRDAGPPHRSDDDEINAFRHDELGDHVLDIASAKFKLRPRQSIS